MRRCVLYRLATLAALCWAVAATAVTVDPQSVLVAQPDGTQLRVRPVGDEFNLFWELPSGVTVVRDADGYWRVAELDRDGRLVAAVERADRVGAQSARRAVPHLRPTRVGTGKGERAPVPLGARSERIRSLGARSVNQPVIVILVQFTDRAPISATSGSFQQAFFGTPRSVAAYFTDVTFGKLQMSPAADTHGANGDGVVGWLSLDMAHPNRGISGSDDATEQEKNQSGHDIRVAVKRAIEAADPYVDFDDYDTDHDGGLSRDELTVVVITAGYESSYGGYKTAYTPANWGHRWALGFSDEIGYVDAARADGVRVGDYRDNGGYASFGEWMQSSASNGHRSSIGVMVHELGHDTLGLPDLYDTDSSSEGVGAWCLMSAGSWGSDGTAGQWSGDVPVALSAWPKVVTDILRPTDLHGSGSRTAAPSALTPSLFRVGAGVDNEYFLVEYRSPVGWDAGLKRWDSAFQSGGGLAVWHVDDYAGTNEDEAHKRVDLEEAWGTQTLDTEGGDQGKRQMLFFSPQVTRFADDTTPSAARYDLASTGVQIGPVGEALGGGIEFGYSVPNAVGHPADDCTSAFAVPLRPGEQRQLSEPLVQATGGDTPPLCAPLSNTAWYRVRAGRTGKLSVESAGFDTVAAVLRGVCGALSVAGCNDDVDSTGRSRITGVAVARGDEVFVVIGRYGSGRGVEAALSGWIALAPADPLTVGLEAGPGPSCPAWSAVVTVAGAAGQLDGLPAGAFHVYLDEREIEAFTLSAAGGGRYALGADLSGAPAGQRLLRIEVDSATAAGQVESSISCPGTVRRRVNRR
ncbi:MAG: M6 family metalloprotease domain-containing protein [Acidobacteriota bacterium]